MTMEDEVRGIVNRILDEALQRHDVDFVDDVAGRITLGVLGTMIGSDEADWPRLYDLANLTVGADDLEFAEPFLRDLASPRAMLREVVPRRPRVRVRRSAYAGRFCAAHVRPAARLLGALQGPR